MSQRSHSEAWYEQALAALHSPLSQFPAPPPVPEVVEHVAAEIIAYRGFLLVPDDWHEPLLHSINHPVEWPTCTLVADFLPMPENSHGIYALKSVEAVVEQGYGGVVLGEVALSGRVVEAQNGYRAERCTIRRLMVWQGWDRWPLLVLQDLLMTRYQCDVDLIPEPSSPINVRTLQFSGGLGVVPQQMAFQQALQQQLASLYGNAP